MPTHIAAQAALALILYENRHSLQSSFTTLDPFNPFAIEIGLRLNHTLMRTFCFKVYDDDIKVEVKYIEPEIYSMRINQIGPWRRITGLLKEKENSLELCTEIDETITKARIIKIHDKLYLFTKVNIFSF